MYCASILVGLTACFSTSIAYSASSGDAAVSPFEGLVRAGYRTAYLIDKKNYTALGEVLTADVDYDSSALGAYGGHSVGLPAVQAALEAAIGDAQVEHLVTNFHIIDMPSPTKAHLNTYITYSHWDSSALDDITKTYRIYYQCEDVWILDPEDGLWKMKTSYVTNTGPKVEAPYFGKQ